MAQALVDETGDGGSADVGNGGPGRIDLPVAPEIVRQLGEDAQGAIPLL